MYITLHYIKLAKVIRSYYLKTFRIFLSDLEPFRTAESRSEQVETDFLTDYFILFLCKVLFLNLGNRFKDDFELINA